MARYARCWRKASWQDMSGCVRQIVVRMLGALSCCVALILLSDEKPSVEEKPFCKEKRLGKEKPLLRRSPMAGKLGDRNQ